MYTSLKISHLVVSFLYLLKQYQDSLEKVMATHSSILAWEIPQTEDSGGLQSMRSQRVGRNEASEHENQ